MIEMRYKVEHIKECGGDESRLGAPDYPVINTYRKLQYRYQDRPGGYWSEWFDVKEEHDNEVHDNTNGNCDDFLSNIRDTGGC